MNSYFPENHSDWINSHYQASAPSFRFIITDMLWTKVVSTTTNLRPVLQTEANNHVGRNSLGASTRIPVADMKGSPSTNMR